MFSKQMQHTPVGGVDGGVGRFFLDAVVHHRLDLDAQGQHVGAVDDFVGVFVLARLAVDQADGARAVDAELAFQPRHVVAFRR